MPARPTVTDEEIRQAGEALLAANRVVTGYGLKTKLGHHGDAGRLMAVWERMQRPAPGTDQPAAPPETPPVLPPDLADKVTAFSTQVTADYHAAVATAWAMAERRAAVRLGEEAAAARTAAEAARLAQNEADEALAATDAAMAALQAECDRLAQTVEALRTANACVVVERDGLIADLAAVRRDLTAAERRAAAAEAAGQAAKASLSQIHNETREATAAATAMREQAAADVATAQAEAAAARSLAEESTRKATAVALQYNVMLAELHQSIAKVNALPQGATKPGRQRPGRADPTPKRPPVVVRHDAVAQPPDLAPATALAGTAGQKRPRDAGRQTE